MEFYFQIEQLRFTSFRDKKDPPGVMRFRFSSNQIQNFIDRKLSKFLTISLQENDLNYFKYMYSILVGYLNGNVLPNEPLLGFNNATHLLESLKSLKSRPTYGKYQRKNFNTVIQAAEKLISNFYGNANSMTNEIADQYINVNWDSEYPSI